MGDPNDTELDRRTILKKSAAALPLGLAGVGKGGADDGDGLFAQDGPDGGDGDSGDRPLLVRRMVFPYPERLGGNLRRKIVLVTDRKDTRPDQLEGVDQNEVGRCNFSGEWPPQNLNVWEGILVDWKNAGSMVGFYGSNPTVEATQLVERNTIFVEGQPSDVPLGTPFIVNSVDKCPGDLVGVETTKVPGIEIKTGPGESTGQSTDGN